MEKYILFQFINNISQFVWWKDLDSNFLGCNENLAKYVGFKNADELVGKSDFDIFENIEEAESVRKIDREIISTGVPQLNFEECLTMQNLGKRWLSTSKIPLYDEEKKIIGTIGWFDDITEFKEMQIQIDEKNKTLVQYSLQLKEAITALESANIDLEKFTYAASHDLKAPVQTMKNFTGLLKEKEAKNLDPISLEYLNFINDSCERMSNLIDDILGYAKSGSKHLVLKNVDLNQIVSEKIAGLKSLIDLKSAEIKLDLPESKIQAYPQLIGLVFYNLINNGIKFNKSETPTITCSYSEDEEYWIFSIQDNGIGIESEFAKQVFEPFKRLGGQEIKGSGLGLSICKRVTVLHKGDLWIEESSKGKTVFKFSISKSL